MTSMCSCRFISSIRCEKLVLAVAMPSARHTMPTRQRPSPTLLQAFQPLAAGSDEWSSANSTCRGSGLGSGSGLGLGSYGLEFGLGLGLGLASGLGPEQRERQ